MTKKGGEGIKRWRNEEKETRDRERGRKEETEIGGETRNWKQVVEKEKTGRK